MTTHTTPVYGISYVDGDSALPDLADASTAAATTIESALLRGGVVPPGAADLNAVTARVVSLENSRTTDENRLAALEALRPGKKLVKVTTPTQPVGTAWALMTWEQPNTQASGTGMYAAANPGRLTATKAGRYRATATVPSNIATSSARQLQLRSQPAGTVTPTASTGAMVGASILQAQTALSVQQVIGDEFVLAVGDWVECYAFSTVASTLFGTQSGYDASFTLTHLGAAT